MWHIAAEKGGNYDAIVKQGLKQMPRSPSLPESPPRRLPAGRLAHGMKVAGALTPMLIVAAAALTHTALGPSYEPTAWHWIAPDALFPVLFIAGVPIMAGHWVGVGTRRRTFGAVGLVVLGGGLLQLSAGCFRTDDFDPAWIRQTIESYDDTGYLGDAIRLVDAHRPLALAEILRQYPEILPLLGNHPHNKPPGQLLMFWYLYREFGQHGAAWAGAAITLAVSMCGTAAVYALAAYVCRDRGAGLYAATLMAICPGGVAYYPMFDCAYPLFTALIVGFWVLALDTGRARYAAICALVFAVAIFFAFQLLILGPLLLAIAAVYLIRNIHGWRRTALSCVTGIGVLVALYAMMRLFSGYDVLATLERCRHPLPDPQYDSWAPGRAYPKTIVWDILEFSLTGVGGAAAALAGYWWIPRRPTELSAGLAAACLGTIGAVGLLGLLPAETARVWIFMMPLALIPAAAELCRWPAFARGAVFLAMWLLLGILLQNVEFVGTILGPPIQSAR